MSQNVFGERKLAKRGWQVGNCRPSKAEDQGYQGLGSSFHTLGLVSEVDVMMKERKNHTKSGQAPRIYSQGAPPQFPSQKGWTWDWTRWDALGLYSPRNLHPVLTATRRDGRPVGEPIGARMGNVPFTASMVSPHEGHGRGKRAAGSFVRAQQQKQPETSVREYTTLARYSRSLLEVPKY